MTYQHFKHIHFTGIGGVGMAGLALICRDLKIMVSGTDMAESRNVELLRSAGATVEIGHNDHHLRSPDVLVYSSAVPVDNPERLEATRLELPQCRRGEFLATLAEVFPQRVSCAGSHGKTSISAMLTHILRKSGRDPGYLIGGQPVNLDRPASAGAKKLLVTEVDESDGTQAYMSSTHAIISNIEDDHCWSVGGPEKLYECFRTFAFKSAYVVAYDMPKTREILAGHPMCHFVADTDIPDNLDIPVPGKHNRINATLALTMAQALGVSIEEGLGALRSFHGVERRMSVRHRSDDTVIIEDYAHHPTEVAATIDALREAYPTFRLHVIFQPHRFERIVRYGSQFSAALSQADRVTVTAPFAAWVDDTALADPSRIADDIQGVPSTYYDGALTHLAIDLAAERNQPTLFAVLGAGNIANLIKPLTEAVRGER